MKRKLKFEDSKNCLEANQFENKVTMQKKIETDTESLKKVLKNNKVILKTQQRFKSQRQNTFTEEINNPNAVNEFDHKRMQSVDSIETETF